MSTFKGRTKSQGPSPLHIPSVQLDGEVGPVPSRASPQPPSQLPRRQDTKQRYRAAEQRNDVLVHSSCRGIRAILSTSLPVEITREDEVPRLEQDVLA